MATKSTAELAKNNQIEQPKFKNAYNMHLFKPWAEKIGKEDTTVPDMSFTIDEIVARFTRGLPITGQKFPIYEGEDELMPDMQFVDKVQLEELRIQYVDELKAIQDRQAQRIKRQKNELEARQNKAINDAVAAALAKQKEANQGTNVQRTTGGEAQ